MFGASPFRLLLAATSLSLAACSPTVHKPHLLSPGPAPYQRKLAENFDPYPLPDLGPDIVGGRPRDFAKPRNEVERSRQFLDSVGASAAPTFAPAPIPAGPPVPLY
jgi:hypothetical protein